MIEKPSMFKYAQVSEKIEQSDDNTHDGTYGVVLSL